MAERRLAVTLLNGRSHSIALADDVDPDDALDVLRGRRTGAEIGWPDGDAEWLPSQDGMGWIRRDAVVEAVVVDWPETRNDVW
jgi:hypothetical protein